MRLAVLSLSLLTAFSVPALAHADNIVVNPDFASATLYPGYGPIAGWTQGPNPSTLNGFPYLTGSNTAGGPFYNNGTAPDGTTVGFIQVYPGSETDSLYQDLTTIVGQTYLLTFAEDARSDEAANLTVAGIAPEQEVVSGAFVSESYAFTATSTTTRLEFDVSEFTPGADATVLLNDVSVTATPEPSSLVLLGTGILGLAGAARRRFRA